MSDKIKVIPCSGMDKVYGLVARVNREVPTIRGQQVCHKLELRKHRIGNLNPAMLGFRLPILHDITALAREIRVTAILG